MSRSRWRKAVCPTPDKKYYDGLLVACITLAKIRRFYRDKPETFTRKPPVRAYACECGLWHLTSREKWVEHHSSSPFKKGSTQP